MTLGVASQVTHTGEGMWQNTRGCLSSSFLNSTLRPRRCAVSGRCLAVGMLWAEVCDSLFISRGVFYCCCKLCLLLKALPMSKVEIVFISSSSRLNISSWYCFCHQHSTGNVAVRVLASEYQIIVSQITVYNLMPLLRLLISRATPFRGQ